MPIASRAAYANPDPAARLRFASMEANATRSAPNPRTTTRQANSSKPTFTHISVDSDAPHDCHDDQATVRWAAAMQPVAIAGHIRASRGSSPVQVMVRDALDPPPFQ